jgi:putative transcriptional regulator
MPNNFHLNSISERAAIVYSEMNVRAFRHIFFCTLLLSGWPSALNADTLDQTPRAQDSSAILLVASRQMADPRFRKTVLLVTRHGNTGPIGVIVNRPESVTLDKMFPDHPLAKELNLFNGGPIYPGQVSYLVRGGDAVERSLVISSNIYLAYDLSNLDEMLSGKRHFKDLRVMHGMASWAPGQLEYEIKLGDWDALPIDETVIFDRPAAEMWQELHRRANRYQEI